MTTETSTVIIRKLSASDGMVITDAETETMRAKVGLQTVLTIPLIEVIKI